MKTVFTNKFLLSIILAILVILYESNARKHNFSNSDAKIDSDSKRDGKGEYEILLIVKDFCIHFIQFYTNSVIVEPLGRAS